MKNDDKKSTKFQSKIRDFEHLTDEQKRQKLLDHVRSMQVDLPLDWKFERDEANVR